MFTASQIHEAGARIRSGADFPAYVQELKSLGVLRYETWVSNGKTVFFGSDDYVLEAEPKYAELAVAETGSAQELRHAIHIHQQGQTDYPTFCEQAGKAGVEKWTTDMIHMTVTYLDKRGTPLVVETIPQP